MAREVQFVCKVPVISIPKNLSISPRTIVPMTIIAILVSTKRKIRRIIDPDYTELRKLASQILVSGKLSLQSGVMSLFETTYTYFQKLSLLPRQSRHEHDVRNWLISWAKSHQWEYQEDTIGNLLIVATTRNHQQSTINEKLCLQAHMDMVCVSEEPHDWSLE